MLDTEHGCEEIGCYNQARWKCWDVDDLDPHYYCDEHDVGDYIESLAPEC